MLSRSKSEKILYSIGLVVGIVAVIATGYYQDTPSQVQVMPRYRPTQWLFDNFWVVGLVFLCIAIWEFGLSPKYELTVTLDESSITFTETGINLVLDCENSDVPEFDKIVYISRAELLFKEELRIQSIIAKELPGLRIRWK